MIVQPTFYVPPEIAAGLLNGDLIRFGGVVRDTAGRLVIHLKEIPAQDEVVKELAKRASVTVKNPWVLVGVGVLTLAAVGGGVVLARKKRKTDAELYAPEYVLRYNRSVRTYLETIQNGNLDVDIIDRLIADLDAVIAHGGVGETAVAFSRDQLAILRRVALEYTNELVKANNIELNEVANLGGNLEDEVVVDLRRYLEV